MSYALRNYQDTRVHELIYSSIDVKPKLILPQPFTTFLSSSACSSSCSSSSSSISISTTAAPQQDVCIPPYAQFLQRHFSYRLACQPCTGSARDKLMARSESDLTAVETLFPDLISPDVILSMAAILSLVSLVGDVLKKMSPDIAQRALPRSISILRSRMPTIIANNSTAHHRLSASSASAIETSSISTSITSSHSLLPPPSPQTCTDRLDRISESFRAHVQAMLPLTTYTAVCDALANVWTSLLAELRFRTRHGPSRASASLDVYMKIRIRTIGLAPCFRLLECSLLGSNNSSSSSSSSNGPVGKSAVLQALEQSVSMAVGLQNDLINLEKDLRNADRMNVVALLAEEQHQKLLRQQHQKQHHQQQYFYTHSDPSATTMLAAAAAAAANKKGIRKGSGASVASIASGTPSAASTATATATATTITPARAHALQRAVMEAKAMHNLAVDMALEYWDILSTTRSEKECMLGSWMVALMERHFMWSTSVHKCHINK